MKKIKVGTINNPYEVVVGSNLINQKNLEVLEDREVLLVIDEKVPSKFKELIRYPDLGHLFYENNKLDLDSDIFFYIYKKN